MSWEVFYSEHFYHLNLLACQSSSIIPHILAHIDAMLVTTKLCIDLYYNSSNRAKDQHLIVPSHEIHHHYIPNKSWFFALISLIKYGFVGYRYFLLHQIKLVAKIFYIVVSSGVTG